VQLLDLEVKMLVSKFLVVILLVLCSCKKETEQMCFCITYTVQFVQSPTCLTTDTLNVEYSSDCSEHLNGSFDNKTGILVQTKCK